MTTVGNHVSIIEDAHGPADGDGNPPWLLLIVDDDDSVHQATRFALNDFSFEDRDLKILGAYSAREARRLIAEQRDTAVILVDVVMESAHGGLELVRWIREELANHRVRIVLRTGQPGFAPEMQVVRDYDINDYKDKSEMAATKLVTSVYSALRSFRDIVQIEHQADRLKEALDTAEVASRAKSDFITHMSHEFRTPLNAILGLSEMIATEALGPIGPARYSEYAWDIVASGRRLQVLLESVLELTESGDEQQALSPEPFDLRALIDEVFTETMGDGDGRFEGAAAKAADLGQTAIMLTADRRAVRTMLSNLVSNALAHNPPNCRVRVTVRQMPNGQLTLSVIDDGVGIAPDVLDRLGDPFKLAGDPYVAGQGNLGLGLAATQKLIERHGGRMVVDSVPGEGTTVRLTFPTVVRPS